MVYIQVVYIPRKDIGGWGHCVKNLGGGGDKNWVPGA